MPSQDVLALLRGGPTAPVVGEDVAIYRPLEGVLAIAVGGQVGGAAATEALRLRADGVAQGPAKPGCRVYNTAAISVPHATPTRLTFNAERFDNDGLYDLAFPFGALICRTPGSYLIFGHVLWASGGGAVRSLRLRLDSSDDIAEDTRPPLGGGLFTSQRISTFWPLTDTELVDLWAYQDSGGALTVVASYASSPEFGMVRVG